MRPVLLPTLVLLLSAPALAASSIAVPPEFRRSAVLCLGEALRLCPNALAAKDHGLFCILGKRRVLSAPCRLVYDEGVRLLGGGNGHLVPRAPRKP